MSPHLILLVEEDASTRAFLADQLAADGYEIVLAESRRHALHLLATHRPAAGARGHQRTDARAARRRAKRRRAGRRDRPAHADDRAHARARTSSTRVRVFDRGGDDVVAKPFSYPELRGRIRALLRRAHEPRPAPMSAASAR